MHLPDPIVSQSDGLAPEDEVVLADSVGLALMVVLDTLTPAERIAFVLHDMFAVPFDDIAAMLKLTKGRVSQLHKRALTKLRDALGDRPLDWSA